MLYGKDIYWYGVQAVSILETGSLHSPDRSPVFYITSLVLSIFGKNELGLFAFQILTFIWLLISFSYARSQIRFQEVRFFWILPSLLLLFLAVSYPKQAWALGFLAIAMGFFSGGRDIYRIGLTFVFWSLSFWFHGFVGLLGFGIFLLSSIPYTITLVMLPAAWVIFTFLPKDMDSRFAKSADAIPLLSAYSLARFPIIWDWVTSLVEGGENYIKNRNGSEKIQTTLWILSIALVFPWFHFADIQFRILLSILAVSLLYHSWNWKNIFYLGISAMLWLGVFVQHPRLISYDYDSMINPAYSISKIPDMGLLIAHHGFCEYFHFTYGKECLSWRPDDIAYSELPKNTKIYRLVSDIHQSRLKRFSDTKGDPVFSYIRPLGSYQLVKEVDWDRYLIELKNQSQDTTSQEQNQLLLDKSESFRNPYQYRPGFLREKHQIK